MSSRRIITALTLIAGLSVGGETYNIATGMDQPAKYAGRAALNQTVESGGISSTDALLDGIWAGAGVLAVGALIIGVPKQEENLPE